MSSMHNTLPRVKYVSHADFIKVRLYEIECDLFGTFPQRVRQFDNDIKAHIDVYGSCPKEIIQEKVKYITEWRAAWRNTGYILVDVTTGEVMLPQKYNKT